MSRFRAFSSPDLSPSATSQPQQPGDDPGLEGLGIATNVKLLLKLVNDHNEASIKTHDDWKLQRVASMMTILDDVKDRIQKSQKSSGKKELRRCNTDLKPIHQTPREKKPGDLPIPEDKDRLRRELSASLVARKSLQMMCASLGKEKEFMATELSRKVHELRDAEELVNDLKKQNKKLLAKVQAAADDKEKSSSGNEPNMNNESLQERNKSLSEQLLKSLDGYRSLKRRYKESREESIACHEAMDELWEGIKEGLVRIRGFKDKTLKSDLQDEISALANLLESLDIKILRYQQKKS